MTCPNVNPDEFIALGKPRKKDPDALGLVLQTRACKRWSCPYCADWKLERVREGHFRGAEHIGLQGLHGVLMERSQSALDGIKKKSSRLGKQPVELAEPAIHGPLHSPLHLPPKPPPDPPKPADWLEEAQKPPLTSTLSRLRDLRGTSYVHNRDKPQVTTHMRPQRLTVTTETHYLILSTHDLSTRATTFRYMGLAEAFQMLYRLKPTTIQRVDVTQPRPSEDPNPHQWRSRIKKPDTVFLGRGPLSKLVPAVAEAAGMDEQDLAEKPIKAEDAEAVRRATYVQMMD